jgi:hypothetical protein
MPTSGDEYDSAAKHQIDWDHKTAREILIDSRVKEARACLLVLDGRELDPVVGDDGVLRIVRSAAKDRVISTVDHEARLRTQDPGQGLRRL